MIPNVPVLLPDEDYSSYVKAVADANLMNTDQLYNSAVLRDNENIFGSQHLYRPMHPASVAAALDIGLGAVGLLAETTSIFCIRPFQSHAEQDRDILPLLGYGRNDINIVPKYRNGDIYTCPCCEKEDLERYGRSYVHRVHQPEMITMCPIHRQQLRLSKTVRSYTSHTMSTEALSKVSTCAEGLMHCHYGLCRDDIMPYFEVLLLQKGYDMDSYSLSRLKKDVSDAGYVMSSHHTSRLDAQDLLCCICYMTDDPAAFIKNIDDHKDYALAEERFRVIADGIGYDTLEYTPVLVRLKHRKCGKEFYTTHNAFINGFQCPDCLAGMETTAFVSHIIKFCSRGTCELIELHGRWKPTITAATTDERAERLFLECSLEDFIYAGRRPAPVSQPNSPDVKEEVQRMLDEVSVDKYTPVSRYKDDDTPIWIRHINCGKDTLMSVKSFRQGRRCSCCTRKLYAEDVSFAAEALYPGRYRVESGETGTVILHDTQTGLSTSRLKNNHAYQELLRPKGSPSRHLPGKPTASTEAIMAVLEQTHATLRQAAKGLPVYTQRAVIGRTPTKIRHGVYMDVREDETDFEIIIRMIGAPIAAAALFSMGLLDKAPYQISCLAAYKCIADDNLFGRHMFRSFRSQSDNGISETASIAARAIMTTLRKLGVSGIERNDLYAAVIELCESSGLLEEVLYLSRSALQSGVAYAPTYAGLIEYYYGGV